MRIGEWVFFKTRNGPKSPVTGEAAHVTDEGRYFSVELTPHSEQCFEVLRTTEDE